LATKKGVANGRDRRSLFYPARPFFAAASICNDPERPRAAKLPIARNNSALGATISLSSSPMRASLLGPELTREGFPAGGGNQAVSAADWRT
jgi:hypothetical protein